MNSASPITFGWAAKGRRSAAAIRAPEVSRWSVAGTQEESCTRRSIASVSAEARNHRKASIPRTLVISCGSQIPVVTPWGRTQRSNS